MAGHDRMKGSANAAWNGVVKPSGPTKKYGGRVKNRRGGAPGGARAGHTARGTSKRCQTDTSADPALRSLMRMREEEDGGPQSALTRVGRAMADKTTGAMNHVCSLLEILRA